MSSGVNVQANGTTLATRSFCAARTVVMGAASGSTAPPASAVITRLRDSRLIVSSQMIAPCAGIRAMIAENADMRHAAGMSPGATVGALNLQKPLGVPGIDLGLIGGLQADFLDDLDALLLEHLQWRRIGAEDEMVGADRFEGAARRRRVIAG